LVGVVEDKKRKIGVNTEKLSYCAKCFTHLKRDTKNGGAPDKPILILGIISLFESKVLIDPRFKL